MSKFIEYHMLRTFGNLPSYTFVITLMYLTGIYKSTCLCR